MFLWISIFKARLAVSWTKALRLALDDGAVSGGIKKATFAAL